MKLVALLTTWLATALLGAFGWAIPWITHAGREGPLTEAAQAIRDEPGSAGLDPLPAFYASHAWIAILAVFAVCGLFSMFSGPRDRWVAVAGYLLLAALLGLGAFGMYGDRKSRTADESLLFYGALTMCAIGLSMSIFSLQRAAFLGALPAAGAALVGLVWSIWFVLSAMRTGVISVSPFGWGLPAAHLLGLIGALISIAVAGRSRSTAAAALPSHRPA